MISMWNPLPRLIFTLNRAYTPHIFANSFLGIIFSHLLSTWVSIKWVDSWSGLIFNGFLQTNNMKMHVFILKLKKIWKLFKIQTLLQRISSAWFNTREIPSI